MGCAGERKSPEAIPVLIAIYSAFTVATKCCEKMICFCYFDELPTDFACWNDLLKNAVSGGNWCERAGQNSWPGASGCKGWNGGVSNQAGLGCCGTAASVAASGVCLSEIWFPKWTAPLLLVTKILRPPRVLAQEARLKLCWKAVKELRTEVCL